MCRSAYFDLVAFHDFLDGIANIAHPDVQTGSLHASQTYLARGATTARAGAECLP